MCIKDTYVLYKIFITGIYHTISPLTLNLNLLNPTGHVMHQQFNIQQLYALPTLPLTA